jgi:4-diphosphocytidyl-2-C-methyl-D-erythritol kinase
MMTTETDLAYAKINISIDILGKMDDGYHNMKMVMQSIALCDEITIECTTGQGVAVTNDLPFLPSDERNIAAKAASAFFKHTGIDGYRTRIRIKKSIPVCAGLGGGSADGACVLRMLDRMFKTRLGQKTLETIGRGVGSDVPFCIAGGTKLSEGRGDILTPLAPIPHCHVVVCKPPLNISTTELFKRVKCEKLHARPDTDGIIGALATGDLKGVARRMYNVFEDVLPQGGRKITDLKYAILDSDALGAVMTGTGSAVFGIFDDLDHARELHSRLSAEYGNSHLTETIGAIPC